MIWETPPPSAKLLSTSVDDGAGSASQLAAVNASYGSHLFSTFCWLSESPSPVILARMHSVGIEESNDGKFDLKKLL